MKILFISNLFPDEKSLTRGQDNANLLHHLSADHEIRVIATRPTRDPRKSSLEVKSRVRDLKFKPTFLSNFYIPKVGSLINHKLYVEVLRNAFRHLVECFHPDVVLCSWSYPDSAAVIHLCNDYQLPVVSIVQGSDAHIYMYMPLRALVVRESLSKADYVITRSIQLGNILSEKGVSPSVIQPVYNGVDKSVFFLASKTQARNRLQLELDTKYLLYVGNFYTVKNPQLLIDSFSIVLQAVNKMNVHLLLIGEGYLKEKLVRMIEESRISEHVTFLGRKSSGEVANYMQSSDLLCIPSFNEGLPNVLLESLSCGLPVVSTDVGGISEVLFDSRCGTLVNSFDTKAYSEAILSRLSQEADTDFIAGFSEQFSWPQTIDRYNEILSLALSRSRNECI